MPAGARWSLLLPAVPAAWFAAALVRSQAKSAHGEVAVALSCSLLTAPLGLASGAPPATAMAVAVAYAAVFVTATLGVRVVVLSVRGGGSRARAAGGGGARRHRAVAGEAAERGVDADWDLGRDRAHPDRRPEYGVSGGSRVRYHPHPARAWRFF